MTRSRIPGELSLEALQALHGAHRESNRDADRLRHFHALDRQQQIDAIRRLAASGMSDRAIAAATQLSIKQICRLLSRQAEQAGSAP
jgi:hypothetical protein